MKAKRKVHKMKLDSEEKALLKSIEKGEWKSIKNLEHEKAKLKKAASEFLHKNAHVNITVLQSDLERIKQLAAYEGLPYQTLISSVVHKYAAGHLDNRP